MRDRRPLSAALLACSISAEEQRQSQSLVGRVWTRLSLTTNPPWLRVHCFAIGTCIYLQLVINNALSIHLTLIISAGCCELLEHAASPSMRLMSIAHFSWALYNPYCQSELPVWCSTLESRYIPISACSRHLVRTILITSMCIRHKASPVFSLRLHNRLLIVNP